MSTGSTPHALARLRGLVDPKTGVIREVSVLSLTERDPVVFMAHAAPASTVPITGIEAANRGAACSAVTERAVIRACGEAVERYCSAFFDFDDMCLASEAQLQAASERFVSPRERLSLRPGPCSTRGNVFFSTSQRRDDPGAGWPAGP